MNKRIISSASGFIEVPNSLLQKAIKLGNDVGFAYQSPPPEYFSNPIFVKFRWAIRFIENKPKQIPRTKMYFKYLLINLLNLDLESCIALRLPPFPL